MQVYRTSARLHTVRRESRLWLVLAIHEREQRNRYTLDCVALDGETIRRDFTAGTTEVVGLRSVPVAFEVAIPGRNEAACPACGGLGRIGDAPCELCHGSGRR